MISKKLFFSLLLLTSTTQFITHTKYVHTFITLKGGALSFIDGRTPGFNGDACLDTLQVRALINKVLRGEPDKATRTFIKPYEFNGKKVALDDLVELEKAGAITPGTELEKEFNKCLRSIKEEFLEFTAPLLSEAEVARKHTLKLVEEWCAQTNRTESIMLNWGRYSKEEERALLFAATAREFRRFCRDLKNFLHDLSYNCPKGREMFKQERLSMLVFKEVFTKLSGKPGDVFETAFNELAEQKVKESDYSFTEHELKQYIDRRKKHKFSSDGQLLEIVFEALAIADNAVSKDAFSELFHKLYNVKCTKFDASFIDKN